MKAELHASTTGAPRVCVLAVALGALAASASAAQAATLTVDRDRAQCANADYRSIQAAVSAAAPGDLIEVCPDLYDEAVIVDKPLTLKGDPDAVEADDCFSLADADPARDAIVDPSGDGFSVALRLRGGDIDLAGFVVQGASVGIDASDSFSGYRMHHNVVQSNTLFAMDVGSEGTRESRVDHNCVRNNRGALVGTGQLGWGIVSELDDDSLWKPSDGPERDDWNARNLINARIDHNTTWRNANAGIDTAGPGLRDRVTVDTNRSVGEALIFQHSTHSAIVANELTDPRGNGIVIGPGNARLLIAGNRVRGAGISGITFIGGLIDPFAIPSTDVVVSDNDVRLTGSHGIAASLNNLASSEITDNTVRENGGTGLLVIGGNANVISGNAAFANSLNGIQFSSSSSQARGNTSSRNVMNGIVVNGSGNEITDNETDDNLRNGITVNLATATGNRFERNSMHGNGTLDPAVFFDARDLSWPNNIWVDNDCETDNQAGAICGAG